MFLLENGCSNTVCKHTDQRLRALHTITCPVLSVPTHKCLCCQMWVKWGAFIPSRNIWVKRSTQQTFRSVVMEPLRKDQLSPFSSWVSEGCGRSGVGVGVGSGWSQQRFSSSLICERPSCTVLAWIETWTLYCERSSTIAFTDRLVHFRPYKHSF